PVALDVGGRKVRPLTFPSDCGEGRCPILGLGAFFGQGGIAVAGKDDLLVWKRGVDAGQIDAPRMEEGESFSALAGAPGDGGGGGRKGRPLTFPSDCGEGRCPILGLGAFFGQGGIAVAGKDDLLVWKRGVDAGQIDAPRMKEGESFSALAGSPRDEVLAMGTELGRLIIWDAKKSKAIKQGAAHTGRVLATRFLADG